MKLLNRLRHEFSTQVSVRTQKQESRKQSHATKAGLALLPKKDSAIIPTLKTSLR
ncbi:hypothetical protein V757_02395 [Pelistega indica]|uniref:Uncharacterized protein n=1 Tax=Pelistega indica TaxID=1414851 RepID=V8G896_9BURK|nr:MULTISPECIES: hypothetical protein [Pelistega]ETD72754.1 hypothetical protein V757_02395 [Pelistega indica]